ncbi:MAG: hypothetical protein ACREJC_06470, partial [Tepidisphaeraceae bacterium]
LIATGREMIFVAKYNPSGNLVWAINQGSDDTKRVRRNVGNGIAVDSGSNVYVTGSYSGPANFGTADDPYIVQKFKNTDAFVEKLNPDGSLAWVTAFGGDSYDGGMRIGLGANGVYAGTYFGDTVTVSTLSGKRSFTATPDEPGEDPEKDDLLISKMRLSDGAIIWAGQIGGPGWETLGGLVVDSRGDVTTTGGFYLTADFNPGGSPASLTSVIGVGDFDDPNDDDRDYSFDVFISKLSTNGKFLYAKQIGSNSDDWGTGLALSSTGTLIVAGQFRGAVNFNTVSSPQAKFKGPGIQDAFACLYDNDNGAIV